jgi:hypothetical protein
MRQKIAVPQSARVGVDPGDLGFAVTSYRPAGGNLSEVIGLI